MPANDSIVTVDVWTKASQRFRDATSIDLSSIPGLDGLVEPDQILSLIDDRQKTFKAYRKQKITLQNSLKPLLEVIAKITPLFPDTEAVSTY